MAQAQLFGFEWSDLAKDLEANEKPLAKEGLQALKAYTLFSLIESHIKLENYLYCLDPERKPRSFYTTSESLKNNSYMFSATKTCTEALEELYLEIFSASRKMRVHMGIAFGNLGISSSQRYTERATDQKITAYDLMINTHPSHIYNELPRIAPLSPDEMEEAKVILKNAEEKMIAEWKEKHANFVSYAGERNLRESARAKQISDSFKEYKKTIESVPVIAFLKNNLMLPPSELDLAVIRKSFETLFQMNCNYISKNFLRQQIAGKEELVVNDLLKINPKANKETLIEETLNQICQYNFSEQNQFQEYASLPWLQDFIAMTNHAYRHQVYNEPSKTFGEPVNYDLEKVMKVIDKKELNTADEISKFLESDEVLKALGQPLLTQQSFDPFHSSIDVANQNFVKFLLQQTPAIERLKRIPNWSQHAKVLEKMSNKVSNIEFWGDLKTAGVFIASGFACQFGFKKIKVLNNLGKKAAGSIQRLLEKGGLLVKSSHGEFNGHFCHLPIGIWGSTYFYKLESHRYDSSFDGFFASPFSNQLVSSYDNLEGARFALTIETLFLIYDLYGLKAIIPNPQPLLKKMGEKMSHIKFSPIKNSIRGAYGH